MKHPKKVYLPLFFLALIALLSLSAFSPDRDWNGKGSITWEAKSVKGYHAKGGFETFSVNHFDLPTGDFSSLNTEVEILMSSVYEKSDGLVTHLKDWDFFDVANFPTAVVYVNGLKPIAENSFEGSAKVRIRDVDAECPIQLKLVPGQIQKVVGTMLVERKTFKIGLPLEKYATGITPTIEVHFEMEVPIE